MPAAMPYSAGLENAKRKLVQLEQARERSGTTGDSSHYTVARAADRADRPVRETDHPAGLIAPIARGRCLL